MQVQALKSRASVFEIDFSTLTSELDMTTLTPSPQDEQLALAQVRQEKSFYLQLLQYLSAPAQRSGVAILATRRVA